jgi:hypothetical protein
MSYASVHEVRPDEEEDTCHMRRRIHVICVSS